MAAEAAATGDTAVVRRMHTGARRGVTAGPRVVVTAGHRVVTAGPRKADTGVEDTAGEVVTEGHPRRAAMGPVRRRAVVLACQATG